MYQKYLECLFQTFFARQPTVSVCETDDTELVVVDTPLMLSVSFDADADTLTTFSTSSRFLPLKILSGSSRGRTSREGVGMMCLGSRGSSDRA